MGRHRGARGRRDAEVSIEPLPSVWAQPQKLQHAFSSLLTSATRHLPESDGAIHIDAVTGGPVTIIRVQDNGSGIPPEDLDGIFEPFGRTSGHRRDRLNAGLAIARRVVQAHGGRLWVTSDVGTGTCFFLQLPCVVQFPADGETTTTLSLSY